MKGGSPMKLYSTPLSHFSRKVRAVAIRPVDGHRRTPCDLEIKPICPKAKAEMSMPFLIRWIARFVRRQEDYGCEAASFESKTTVSSIS